MSAKENPTPERQAGLRELLTVPEAAQMLRLQIMSALDIA